MPAATVTALLPGLTLAAVVLAGVCYAMGQGIGGPTDWNELEG